MLTDEYTVRLSNFQGPLDLLLFLIRRAEVDITEVSIAAITDQYLAFLEDLEFIDVEAAGEFLVTAAALLEIKSRFLAPVETPEDAGDGSPGARSRAEPSNPAAELIEQLLQYRRFREAADRLERRRAMWAMRSPLGRLGLPHGGLTLPVDGSELDELSLFDLVQAYGRVAETVQFERLGDHRIISDDTPIELYAADVLDRLRRASRFGAGEMTMGAIFAERNRAEVIGLFLAVLELVRQGAVRVQARTGGGVVISLAPDAPAPTEAAAAPTETPKAWDDDDPFEEDPEPDDGDDVRTEEARAQAD